MIRERDERRPAGLLAGRTESNRRERRLGAGWRRLAGLCRGRWAPLLRVAASAALISFILQRTSISEIGSVLGQTLDRWPLLAIAAGLPIFGMLFAVLRWRVLLGGVGVQPRLRSLYGAMLVGSFFNFFLPSTIGGDLARSWWIRRNLGSGTLSLTVVVVDRLIGLVGICTVGLVAATLHPSLVGGLVDLWAIALVVGTIPVVLVALYHAVKATAGGWVFALPGLRHFRDKAAIAY